LRSKGYEIWKQDIRTRQSNKGNSKRYEDTLLASIFSQAGEEYQSPSLTSCAISRDTVTEPLSLYTWDYLEVVRYPVWDGVLLGFGHPQCPSTFQGLTQGAVL
jgi:hypothetical protein